MHWSGFTSTIPLAYWTIAPGAGQAARHPGSSQCMHWSLRISQMRPPSKSRSLKRIRFQYSACRVGSVWYVPVCAVAICRRSFHSMHAASQALQPMQVVVSMYFATVGTDRIPDRLPHTEAEERRISRFCCTLISSSSSLLDAHEEGLVLRRP